MRTVSWETCECYLRASDRDREATVGVLRDAYAAGRLALDEVTDRSTVAYSATTWGELRQLMADIPFTCCTALGCPDEETARKMGRNDARPSIAAGRLISFAFLAIVSAAVWGSAAVILLIVLFSQLLFAAGWVAASPDQRAKEMGRPGCPVHGSAHVYDSTRQYARHQRLPRHELPAPNLHEIVPRNQRDLSIHIAPGRHATNGRESAPRGAPAEDAC